MKRHKIDKPMARLIKEKKKNELGWCGSCCFLKVVPHGSSPMSNNRGMDKKMWFLYTMEYYSAIKRMK